jgi:hypothetical protein
MAREHLESLDTNRVWRYFLVSGVYHWAFSKMADEKEDKNSKNVKKDVYIPQTHHDVQRRKIEKLMSNPVGVFFTLIYLLRHLL